ncbi:MAG: O-methyltransferase [Spirochaetaceae bacterium]|nr:O-methyltransferase [Spirochaetaceae bacterium]
MADNPPLSPQLGEYLDGLVPERHAELQIMEQWGREHRFPIVGPASGNMCYLIARLIGARRVFELGSGYGYSTAWFCRAVQENGGGVVHHVVWDEELSARARGHLTALGYGDLVRYHVSEAVQALRGEPDGGYDLIFNDIDKDGYPAALPVIEAKLRPGGVLIIDNMLLRGRVYDRQATGADLEGVREFTRMITTDDAWVTTLVPIRDGLIVAQRR